MLADEQIADFAAVWEDVREHVLLHGKSVRALVSAASLSDETALGGPVNRRTITARVIKGDVAMPAIGSMLTYAGEQYRVDAVEMREMSPLVTITASR